MPVNTELKGKEIKYVHVELIYSSKDNKHDVVSGLFKGILERGGKKFILTNGLKDNVTNCMNAEYYKILKIEHQQNDFRTMVFCTAEKVDQDDADKMLASLYESLKAAGRNIKEDLNIIDVSTYSAVPTELGVNKSTQNSTAGVGVGSFASATNRYSNNGTAYTRTAVKKDPEPLFFRNKRKKKDAVEAMQQKMQQLRAGEYQTQIPDAETPEDFDGGKDEHDPGDYYNSHYM